MATIDELVKQGHLKIRLPQWNECAYLEFYDAGHGMVGPWATLHDIGGYEEKSIAWLRDTSDKWIPHSSKESANK